MQKEDVIHLPGCGITETEPFLQRDPAGYADSMCLYSYVKNNPLMFVDPSGMLSMNPLTDMGMKDAYGFKNSIAASVYNDFSYSYKNDYERNNNSAFNLSLEYERVTMHNNSSESSNGGFLDNFTDFGNDFFDAVLDFDVDDFKKFDSDSSLLTGMQNKGDFIGSLGDPFENSDYIINSGFNNTVNFFRNVDYELALDSTEVIVRSSLQLGYEITEPIVFLSESIVNQSYRDIEDRISYHDFDKLEFAYKGFACMMFEFEEFTAWMTNMSMRTIENYNETAPILYGVNLIDYTDYVMRTTNNYSTILKDDLQNMMMPGDGQVYMLTSTRHWIGDQSLQNRIELSYKVPLVIKKVTNLFK